jgi:hypothetical protein
VWAKGEWEPLRIRAVTLIREHPKFGHRSGRALAKYLGLGHSTTAKYLRGRLHPAGWIREPLAEWLAFQERAIEEEGRRK